ncbi:MAG: Coenzyme F420 hydrogenase/dehydrogenase, beta subunit C-terminal domain [Verrucomicrobia bacterium]|nr:Coenzyme F420 hydrogenase/dehydrogenase, beta subunit C-terminal domain [Verrucomicrobiota bacterium]
MRRLKSIADVVRWRLCHGCGTCAAVCSEANVRMVNIFDEGNRPAILDPLKCRSCEVCLEVCPAYEVDHSALQARAGIFPELAPFCGPVIEAWEGHAKDPEIRLQGSSGGVLTALALYCLERLGMHGVLHVGSDPASPLRNCTGLSRTRQELLAKTGSRYAPASACDSLHLIESAPAPCIFIGQPTEVSGLRKVQRLRPELDKRVGVALSFFCAGSPPTKATVELLRKLKVDPAQVGYLRYRGNGWPGMFSVTLRGQTAPCAEMTYHDSWAFIQAFRPYSVRLNPDDTGEDADISCGDPWYREVKPGEAGSSLLIVRTELGRGIVREAMEAGYLELTPAEPSKVVASQKNLINKRRTIWGRRLAFRAFGLPVTRLRGFPLFRLWLRLSFKEKLKSTLGTARRILQRGYCRPLDLQKCRINVEFNSQ